jgi:hypothetical protein
MSKITVLRFIGYVALVARFVLIPAHAALLEVTLVDHVITYTDEGGHRQRIDVGKPCEDLWIAPDGSAFAFIGIDKYMDFPDDPPSRDAIASTVYIARRSDHFTPKPIADTVGSRRYEYHQIHSPSISSDGAYVFFVGIPGNAVFLYAHNLRTGNNEYLDVNGTRSLLDYCTVWSGRSAGGVLLQELYWIDSVGGEGGDRCYLKTPGKARIPASCAPLQLKFRLMGAACAQTTP